MSQRILIIGSSTAGISTAEAARQQTPDAQIDLFSEDPHLTYYRPRLYELVSDHFFASKILLHPLSWYEENV